MNKFIYIIFVTAVLFSCKSNTEINSNGILIENNYAKGYKIYETSNGYNISVADRFSSNTKQSSTYVLTTENPKTKDNNIIQIPIKNAVCLSSTHCAFISQLDESSSIKGISGTNYLYNEELRNLAEKGKIIDIGNSPQIDIEKIVSLNPDVVFTYGVDNSEMAIFQKLHQLRIPTVHVGDFLESSALARSEWIKFFACFYNKLENANTYFDSINNNYSNIQNRITENEYSKLKILLNLPWKGIWYIPGANSYMANLIADAGGKYTLTDKPTHETVPLSIEQVIGENDKPDIWLNPNNVNTIQEIIDEEPRLANTDIFTSVKIFNNNKRQNKHGGNDFFESGILKPDAILSDLEIIFSKDSSNYHNLIYYQEIK